MGRVTRVIDATVDQVNEARQTALALAGESAQMNIADWFYSDNLEEIENGIRELNKFSSKTWVLSGILIYTLIYNESLYSQSGLDWYEYSRQARERLGIDNREITEQLGAARFFIKNYKALEKRGFKLEGNNKKLARAELAEKLCGSTTQTLDHLCNDTCTEFKLWYSSFKQKPKIENDRKRTDLRINGDRFYIGKTEAVKISDKIPEADGKKLKDCIKSIFKILADGYEPAIIAVYDKKEASLMPKLRDKYRKGR